MATDPTDTTQTEQLDSKRMKALRAALSESPEPLPGFWNLLGEPMVPKNMALKWCKHSAYSLALGKCLGEMYDSDETRWPADYRELGKHYCALAFGAALMCAQANAVGSADGAAAWRSKCERFAELLNGHVQSLSDVAGKLHADGSKRAHKLALAIYGAQGVVTTERVRQMWADLGGKVAAWETN